MELLGSMIKIINKQSAKIDILNKIFFDRTDFEKKKIKGKQTLYEIHFSKHVIHN